MKTCEQCGDLYTAGVGHLCTQGKETGTLHVHSRFPPEPQYKCPRHGELGDVITSSVEGHEGSWCQICWLEALDRLGVCRVEKVRDIQGNDL